LVFWVWEKRTQSTPEVETPAISRGLFLFFHRFLPLQDPRALKRFGAIRGGAVPNKPGRAQ
jgi:hypothetical protein